MFPRGLPKDFSVKTNKKPLFFPSKCLFDLYIKKLSVLNMSYIYKHYNILLFINKLNLM